MHHIQKNMLESIKKVEATRAKRMAAEPRRMTAEEKDALLEKFHPDYNQDAFAEIKVGPNKGQKRLRRSWQTCFIPHSRLINAEDRSYIK